MTVQEISLVVQMRRILSDRNMFSTLYSLANIKVFKRNSQLSTILLVLNASIRVYETLISIAMIYDVQIQIGRVDGRNGCWTPKKVLQY